MIFDFEEPEIQFIYSNLRKFPLPFDDVQPIINKIESQYNKNKIAATEVASAPTPSEE